MKYDVLVSIISCQNVDLMLGSYMYMYMLSFRFNSMIINIDVFSICLLVHLHIHVQTDHIITVKLCCLNLSSKYRQIVQTPHSNKVSLTCYNFRLWSFMRMN